MNNKKNLVFVFMLLGLGVVIAVLVYWLWMKPDQQPMQAGQALGAKGDSASKPVLVNTVLAQERDFAVKLMANGVVSSLNVVEVRPQLSSVIEKVHIKEGQFVRAGDALFSLDQRTEASNAAKAQAQLDKELATLAELQRQAVRSRELVEKKFQAQSVLDASLSAVQAQQAVVESARASVNVAKVALGYSKILAPVSGRTGLINVFAGSLVQPSSGTAPLVTITQMDPIAVSFPLPQRSLSAALAAMKRGDASVVARLPESNLSLRGQLQFVDNVVDAVSGTVKVKAVFQNQQMALWPGAYVNVELSVQTLKNVVVLPQDALVVGVNASSVYVVDAEQKAAQKKVEVLASFAGEVVVEGIAPGSQVILEGKQHVRPGSSLKLGSEAASSKAADRTRSASAYPTHPTHSTSAAASTR